MNRTPFSMLAAALSLASIPLAAQDMLPLSEQYKVRLEYRRFSPEVSGIVQGGFGDLPGSLIDIEQDLGLVKQKTWMGVGSLQLKPGIKLRGSYTKIDLDGDAITDRALFFQGTIFPAGVQLLTSVKGAYWTGDLEFDFLKGSWGYFGAMVGGKFFDVDSVLVAPQTGQREARTLSRPIPSLGLAFRAYANRLSVSGEASGLTLGEGRTIIELDASVRLNLSDRSAIQGGYRYIKIKGEDGLDSVDGKVKGWTYGLEISL